MKTNRFRFIVAALLIGAFAVLSADPAAAFIRLGRQLDASSPVVQAHWLDTDLPLKSAVDPTNNDITPANALLTVQACGQSWQDINTCYFTVDVHQWASPETQPDLEFDGQNSVFFDGPGTNFAPGSGVIAFVRSIVNLVDGQTLDADMVFNDRDFYSSISTPSLTPAPSGQTSVDLQSVLTHEYGHYFGLDHTSVTGATMIPFISNNISQRTLELDDQAGLSDVYPESVARGLSADGVDFRATTGIISGTVVSGYNGSAIFGAHVEAFNLAIPDAAHSISNISGELTLRNGQGDWSIRGLPPGSYAVRIVPLDGINTTAADANVGGPYNGLDINFEPEFWNGTGEGPDGFTDSPGLFDPIAVNAGATSSGINFQTNTYAGRVIMAQHGSFENIVTFRNTGFLCVRFDPPFDGAYTITNVTFPSFTFNGVPAGFLSARLCPLSQVTGGPDLGAPLFTQTPFNGNPNGINTVNLNIPGTVGATYFWCLQFPSQAIPGFPNNFPFLRMDFTQLDKGLYANSYSVSLAGAASVLVDRNVIVDMTCQVPVSDVPIVGPASFGGNRTATQMEFAYRVAPTDTRADGFAMPQNSLAGAELLSRSVVAPTFQLTAVDTAGAGNSTWHESAQPSSTVPVIWSSRSIDKNGNRSINSNVTITGFGEDADEPNGRVNQPKIVATPVTLRSETNSPAGDLDFFEIMAKPGDIIDASAAALGQDGNNNMDLVMLLFDNQTLVAANDDFSGLNPRVTYAVPTTSENGKSKAPRKFRIMITDITSSDFAPTAPPQVRTPSTYAWSASVTPTTALAGRISREIDPNKLYFANSGPNPANPQAKFLYAIPKGAGADVSLRIYDVSGRMVRNLVKGFQSAGPHAAIWDGKDDNGRGVSSGKYFARIKAGTEEANATVTILK